MPPAELGAKAPFGVPPPASGRLVIRAHADDFGAVRPGREVRRWWSRAWRHAPRGAVSVQIHDLQGHCFYAAQDAAPTIDIALRPGTYEVSVHRGASRRRYSITLESGATVDVAVRLDPA
jgi:hypothetical protein